MRLRRVRAVAVAGGFLAVTACNLPERVELEPATQPPPRHEFEIWRSGKGVTLHGVQVTDSALSGVPMHRAPDCADCERIIIPRAEVDSVRRVSTERTWILLGAAPGLAIVGLAEVFALYDGGDGAPGGLSTACSRRARTRSLAGEGSDDW